MHLLLLSPHRDDAAFSCGLTVLATLRSCSAVTIVNVCTVSDYAPYLADTGDDRTAQVTAVRAEEDNRFDALLREIAGPAAMPVRWMDLEWRDAPLRREMATEDVLTVGDATCDEVESLVAVFRGLPPADGILAPLGLGSHLDHRLVRDAAQRAFGPTVVFYEDLPYACRMDARVRTACVEATLPVSRMALSLKTGGAGDLKCQFAKCYPSQISEDVAEEMRRYACERDESEGFYGSAGALQRLESIVTQEGAAR